MSESRREHAPKVAALRAEAAGLLSGEGRARLLRHVEGCEVCAEHLRGARRFHALVSRATGVPSFDAENSVRSAVMRNRLAQRRTRIQWGGVLVAAGVLLAVMLATRHNEELHAVKPPVAAPSKPAAAPIVESKLLGVAVTALRGAVYVIEPARPERLLSIDDTLAEHSVLRSSSGASLDLALGAEAAVHVAGDSEIALDAVRSDQIALRLIRGVVSNSVHKRGAQQTYEVIAAGHRVAVRGTLFAVRAGGDAGVSVRCDEGVVEVIAPNGKSALLTAPASWSEHVGGAAGAQPAQLEVIKPYAIQGGAVLTLPATPGIEAWEIGGHARPASELLRMRVPPGALDFSALLGGGRREAVHVEVDGIGAQVEPKDLAFLKPVEPHTVAPAPEPAAGSDIDASSVILAGRPTLQRCYEKSLKNESSGSQALRLSISIDPRGRVKKVEPTSQKAGETLPPELAQCIRIAVMSWHFPAPGGDGLQLEAPLRFQLRR